jgi:ubiquinone/menaquinone biosynthesis C-methylase UbiE
MSLPTDPVPYAEFIVRHLMQHPVPGESLLAVSETELPIDGDLWFWADDNAKILEFFAIPELWHRYPEESKSLLKFINGLCFGPFILRRIGHPRLEQLQNDGSGKADFIHTFMHIGCELQRGIVNVGIRFHDGRTARNLTFASQEVEFTHNGTRHRFAANDFIDKHEIIFSGDSLVLQHSSIIDVAHGEEKSRIGRLTYTYTFSARSMFINAEVDLVLEKGITVSDVILGFSHDDLSHGENYVFYSEINTLAPDEHSNTVAAEPGEVLIPVPGVTYWSVTQNEFMRGFSLAVHTLVDGANEDRALKAEVREKGRLHRIFSTHAYGGVFTGTALHVSEQKVLTSGGFYDQVQDYESMLRHFGMQAQQSPIDFSLSYDYGAELNSFARVFRALSNETPSPDSDILRNEVKALFDRYFEVYDRLLLETQKKDPTVIFSRSLSFAIFGLVDMWYATKEQVYLDNLRSSVDVLLTFVRNEEGEDGKPISLFVGDLLNFYIFVDCHSAALMALVRALPVLEDPSLITIIDQGLDAYRIETLGIPLGDMRKEDLVCLGRLSAERQLHSHSYWNFTAGLTLRLFKMLRQSPHQATQEIFERHRSRIALHEALLKLRIEQSLRDRNGALEIKTGRLSGEGNSETQPWVALGVIAQSEDIGFSKQETETRLERKESMRVLRTVAELDEMITLCDEAERRSDDDMRKLFPTFCMAPPSDLPADPFSEEYREFQMKLYRGVSGKSYSTANEVTGFDARALLDRPFPYYTGSMQTTGEHFLAIGFLFRLMQLPPNSRIIEFGPGWGHVAIMLAQLGHQVTVVDIEKNFCDLIRLRAERENVKVNVIQGDFLVIKQLKEKFDAAIFFECFHHCEHHMELLAGLKQALSPKGKIFFGAEPVVPDFPMPWGLRLDGNSLWAIRKNGWLELGFRDDYFREALNRTGWIAQKVASKDQGWLSVWVASNRDEVGGTFTGGSNQLSSEVGERIGDCFVFNGRPGTGIYGPYVALPGGRYTASLKFATGVPLEGAATMDVAHRGGQERLAFKSFKASEFVGDERIMQVTFDLPEDVSDLEVRLFCGDGFKATFSLLEIIMIEAL